MLTPLKNLIAYPLFAAALAVFALSTLAIGVFLIPAVLLRPCRA